MTIYHFCADKHVKNIMQKGLTVRIVIEPTKTVFYFHKGWMWLTLDPDPNLQSWATQNRVKYNRTAWRLTIEIPEDELHKLYDREKLTALYPACDALFEGWPGSDNWRVFHGMIPKQWIVNAKRM